MTFINCFDTETTDLPIWSTPSDDPAQPFVVSLAMLELDPETLEECSAFYSILKPPAGRTIPEDNKAFEAHGITNERAMDEGIDREEPIREYARKRGLCVSSLAHNASFDVRMMRIELLRLGFTKEEIEAIEASSPQLCTMRMATPVLNIAPTMKMKKAGFGGKPKNASLADCLQYLFDEQDSGAHNALADARACARVFRKLREMETA